MFFIRDVPHAALNAYYIEVMESNGMYAGNPIKFICWFDTLHKNEVKKSRFDKKL